ncbi:MAG: hypothetical protein ACFB0B_15005 [Thermonemataceae bacterium]
MTLGLSEFYLPLMIIAFIIGLTKYPFFQPNYLKTFVGFIFISILPEVIPIWWEKDNHIIYNIYRLIETPYLCWLYSRAVHKGITRQILTIITIVAPLVFILTLTDWHQYNTTGGLISNIVIIFIIVTYFLDLLRKPTVVDLIRLPLFWISVGLLFFYIGNTPFHGILNYLNQHYRQMAVEYMLLTHILIIIMYICFIIGFLCRPLNQK